MAKELNTSDVNHLRRLLGYVRCEIWQSPEEFVQTLREIAPHVGHPDDAAQRRLKDTYEKSARVPKYVRAAVKALEKVVKEIDGDVVDADTSAARALSHRPAQLRGE
jgi:hypothetical protein